MNDLKTILSQCGVNIYRFYGVIMLQRRGGGYVEFYDVANGCYWNGDVNVSNYFKTLPSTYRVNDVSFGNITGVYINDYDYVELEQSGAYMINELSLVQHG